MSSVRACHSCQSDELELHASIDTFTAGIEYSDSFLQCLRCETWTLLSWKDSWAGEPTTFRETVSEERAKKATALITACPDPRNSSCECAAHVRLKRG